MTLEQIKASIERTIDQAYERDDRNVAIVLNNVLTMLNNLEQWHPYPKEKPPRYGWYNVTLNDKGRLEVYTSFYSKGGFVWFYDNNIIAWAELPKPYEKDK